MSDMPYSSLHRLLNTYYGGEVTAWLSHRYWLDTSPTHPDEVTLWRCTRYGQPVGARLVNYDSDGNELAMLDSYDATCDFRDYYTVGQAWFGGHLWRDAGDVVAVCENELTALYIATREPRLTVYATSPCHPLTAALMQQYAIGKRLILFSLDNDLQRWREVAMQAQGVTCRIIRLIDYWYECR